MLAEWFGDSSPALNLTYLSPAIWRRESGRQQVRISSHWSGKSQGRQKNAPLSEVKSVEEKRTPWYQ